MKGARNLKAAKALLDVDALKASKNQDADIDAAIEALTKGEESAFIFEAQKIGRTDIGRATGNSAGPMTREEIMKIQDYSTRQTMIRQNPRLFGR